jgi:HK97 gp10 family phage protein
VRVHLYPAAVAALAAHPDVLARMRQIGELVAERAQQSAPRGAPSKGGAESIHAEVVSTNHGPEIHVSWTPEHFYLRFNEEGSEHQPARPFLRPAAESIR